MNSEPNPDTLQAAIQFFSDEDVCIQMVADMRWGVGKLLCPDCGNEDGYYIKTQRRWKCRECRSQFSVKVGTVFGDSPIPLRKWFVCLWMLRNCKKGKVNSYEMARELGITQATAWFMLHRLRIALRKTRLKRKPIDKVARMLAISEAMSRIKANRL